jgi:nucleoside-diphosphate-sugar epimerase
MAVLVTGAGGFLGGHLLRALAQRGHAVRAFSRRALAPEPGQAVQEVVGDVRDAGVVGAALGGVSTVFHVAGVVPGRGGAAQMESANVAGTRVIAQGCARAGVRRLVLVSSVAAYRAPLGDIVPESAPTGGTDAYGRSKADAEAAAQAICAGRLELVIARPCQIYGPLDRSGYTARMLRLVASAGVPVAGWQGRGFSLVHVDDVADALCAAGELEGLDGTVFNVAPQARVTLLELARLQAAVRGRGWHGVRLPVPAALLRGALALRWTVRSLRHEGRLSFKSYAAPHGSLLLGGPLYDTTHARGALGFRARTTPEQGLAQLLCGRADAAHADPRTEAPEHPYPGGGLS